MPGRNSFLTLRPALIFTPPAALALIATPAHAQQHDGQAWFQVNTAVPITEKLRITLEQIARFSDRQDGLYQTEFGGILDYRIASNVTAGFGYRRVGAHNGNRSANEHRIRQHVVATFGPVTSRLRVDERFDPRGRDVGIRVRPLLRYNYRLRPQGVALFVSHESFFLPNSTGWGQRRGYERMRNSVGLTVPLGKAISTDIGYLSQYRFSRGGARPQMDHALSVQMTISVADLIAPALDD